MQKSLLCRVLSESEPKAKLELSANQSGTLNESKPKVQPEFSERDKQRTAAHRQSFWGRFFYEFVLVKHCIP